MNVDMGSWRDKDRKEKERKKQQMIPRLHMHMKRQKENFEHTCIVFGCDALSVGEASFLNRRCPEESAQSRTRPEVSF